MDKTKDQIVGDVRIAIDEIAVNDSDFLDEKDGDELDAIIESKIEDAIDFVHGNAAIEKLSTESLSVIKNSEFDDGNEMSYIAEVPDDFLRFVQAQCSTWVRAVTEVLTPMDPLFSAAKDEYVHATVFSPAVLMYEKMVKTSGENPDALGEGENPDALGEGEDPDALGEEWESRKVIELVGRSRSRVAEYPFVWYVKKATMAKPSTASSGKAEGEEPSTDSSGYYVDANLYRAVVYYCASLTMLTFREGDFAKELAEVALSLMGASSNE